VTQGKEKRKNVELGKASKMSVMTKGKISKTEKAGEEKKAEACRGNIFNRKGETGVRRLIRKEGDRGG